MITVSAVGFVAIVLAVLVLGIWLGVRGQRESARQDDHVARFLRAVDARDQAGKTRSR